MVYKLIIYLNINYHAFKVGRPLKALTMMLVVINYVRHKNRKYVNKALKC